MNQSVTLHYTPTQQDYARVLRLFFWNRTSTKVSLVALAIAFGLILYVIVSSGGTPSVFEWIWLLLPPAFVGFIFFIQPGRVARQAVQNERLVAETTWMVSDSGVEISTRFNSSVLEWESLESLYVTRDYYLLLSRVNKNAFRFIPRRAFISSEVQGDFLQIMESHIAVKP